MDLAAKGALPIHAQGNPHCHGSEANMQLSAACAKNNKLGTE